MTLRELINQVTNNPPLNNYLSNFDELDFELKINATYDDEQDFTIKIDRGTQQITLETY